LNLKWFRLWLPILNPICIGFPNFTANEFGKDHTRFRCVQLISLIVPITFAVSAASRDICISDRTRHFRCWWCCWCVAAYSVRAIDLPICQI